MFKEAKSRSLIKMISWRVLATLTTMTLVYIFVGKIEIAVTVGVFEVIAKMIIYYFHERSWNKIKWGRHQVEPFVVWFTGLPVSGKTTLANMLHGYLVKEGLKAERLDGEKVRTLFPLTGFSKEDRDRHVKRVGYLASMLEKNGVIVVASFISPYKESRDFVRNICGQFIEVYTSASAEACEKRDTKGMYKKARSGEIENFTGVSDPYEVPTRPQLVVDTEDQSPEESFQKIKKYIAQYL